VSYIKVVEIVDGSHDILLDDIPTFFEESPLM
jgi:hypothetical protein